MTTMTHLGARKERSGLEMESLDRTCARIRSTWPVTSFRENTCPGTKLLREALEEGIEVKCDAKRIGFFETDIGNAWCYFHIARQFRRVYLIAIIR